MKALHDHLFRAGRILALLVAILRCENACAVVTGLETWENSFSVAPQVPITSFQKVAVSNHRFVALSPQGLSAYSDDGVKWTNNTKTISSGFVQVTGLSAGAGRFVAAGGSSLLSSTDGIHWTNYLAPKNISTVRDVIYGNNQFVAVGGPVAGAAPNNIFLTSADGTNWQRTDVTLSARIDALTAGEGRFIGVGASGKVWNSPDGKSWTEVAEVPAALSDCAYGNGWFVAVGGGGTIALSEDGSHWSLAATGLGGNLSTVRFAGGIFYATMQFEALFGFDIQLNGEIRYLTPPLATDLVFGSGSNPYDVTYDAGHYIAVGGGSIWNSADGRNWITVAGSRITSQLSQIAAVDHRYFAFGQVNETGREYYSRSTLVLTSTDLHSWQKFQSEADPQSRKGYIGFGSEIFAFEGPRIIASSDGIDWAVRYAETNFTSPCFAIDSTAGTLVAWSGLTLSKGVVATSHDGVIWQRHTGPPLKPVDKAAAGNNIVVGALSRATSDNTNTTT